MSYESLVKEHVIRDDDDDDCDTVCVCLLIRSAKFKLRYNSDASWHDMDSNAEDEAGKDEAGHIWQPTTINRKIKQFVIK